MPRGHCLNCCFIYMKLKLGEVVGPVIVTHLLEHSQVLTFPLSFHTVFNFLSYKCPSKTCHSEGQSCEEYHLPLNPPSSHWLIIVFMSNNLKSVNIVKTLILFFTFKITVRKNRKTSGSIFSKGILLVIILLFCTDMGIVVCASFLS